MPSNTEHRAPVRPKRRDRIPERHRKIGPLSRRLFQVYLGVILEALEPYDLDPAFYSVLVELADQPGIDQRRLCEALGIDRTTIGEIVDELEGRGLIDRRVHPEDRRRAARRSGRGCMRSPLTSRYSRPFPTSGCRAPCRTCSGCVSARAA